MPELATPIELSRKLGISKTCVYKWVERGLLVPGGVSEIGTKLYSYERAIELRLTVRFGTPLETAFRQYNHAIATHFGHRQDALLTKCGGKCPELAGGFCKTYQAEVIPLFKVWHRLHKGEKHGTDHQLRRDCG